MARFVHYRCPECRGTFRHLHHPSDALPPDRCSLCGAWVSDEEPPQEVFIPQAPGIRKSSLVASVDQTYRQMEEASIQRSEDAGSMLEDVFRRENKDFEGNPEILHDLQRDQVAAMKAGLKITNMRDPSEMRAGDTAAIVTGDAAQRLTIGSSKPGFQDLSGGIPNNAPGVGGYAERNSLVEGIKQSHSERATAMI